MSATTTQLLSSGEFCKLRYDTIPVKSASANVSFCTINWKMPNFELWHFCRKRAIFSSSLTHRFSVNTGKNAVANIVGTGFSLAAPLLHHYRRPWGLLNDTKILNFFFCVFDCPQLSEILRGWRSVNCVFKDLPWKCDSFASFVVQA
jgi:hypothetical protein